MEQIGERAFGARKTTVTIGRNSRAQVELFSCPSRNRSLGAWRS